MDYIKREVTCFKKSHQNTIDSLKMFAKYPVTKGYFLMLDQGE